jgi:long-subunit acyl-CoA synthetase (AMP-forming)
VLFGFFSHFQNGLEKLRDFALEGYFSKIHTPFGDKLRFFVSGGAKLDPEVSRRF